MRPWIVSLLLVGSVVGAILYLAPGGGTEGRRTAPPPLRAVSDREVRAYITVYGQVYRELGKVAHEFASGRPTADVQLLVSRLARENHLSLEELDGIRTRVEETVKVLRWEADAGPRGAQLRQEIADRRAQLDRLKGDARKLMEGDIRQREELLAAQTPAVPEQSREAVMSYWAQLDALVPKPPPSSSEPSEN